MRAVCSGPALLVLLLVSHAVAQEMPAPMPTEPEAHWIYPLGGRQGARVEAEVDAGCCKKCTPSGRRSRA